MTNTKQNSNLTINTRSESKHSRGTDSTRHDQLKSGKLTFYVPSLLEEIAVYFWQNYEGFFKFSNYLETEQSSLHLQGV